jgi:hypothetical protein
MAKGSRLTFRKSLPPYSGMRLHRVCPDDFALSSSKLLDLPIQRRVRFSANLRVWLGHLS